MNAKAFLEELNQLNIRLRMLPPRVRQIYFMDRPDAYKDLISILRKKPANTEVLFYELPVLGIQLSNLSTTDYVCGIPECCSLPGIWAIMSDGTYKQLDAPQEA